MIVSAMPTLNLRRKKQSKWYHCGSANAARGHGAWHASLAGPGRATAGACAGRACGISPSKLGDATIWPNRKLSLEMGIRHDRQDARFD